MKRPGHGRLLRIFLGESDRLGHQPLYEALVQAARARGLAGTTVLRGIEGFGANSRVIHTAKILRLSEDLPLVVEIVEEAERIQAFLQEVETMLEEANGGVLVTLEDVEVIRYSHTKA
jgi:uncharacterized protein